MTTINKLLLTAITLTTFASANSYNKDIKKECVSSYNEVIYLNNKMNDIKDDLHLLNLEGVAEKNAYTALYSTRFVMNAQLDKFILCNEGKTRNHYSEFANDGYNFYLVKLNDADNTEDKKYFSKRVQEFKKMGGK